MLYTCLASKHSAEIALILVFYRCWSHLGVIPHNLKSNTVNISRFAYLQGELECYVSQCKFSSIIISTDPRIVGTVSAA